MVENALGEAPGRRSDPRPIAMTIECTAQMAASAWQN